MSVEWVGSFVLPCKAISFTVSEMKIYYILIAIASMSLIIHLRGSL